MARTIVQTRRARENQLYSYRSDDGRARSWPSQRREASRRMATPLHDGRLSSAGFNLSRHSRRRNVRRSSTKRIDNQRQKRERERKTIITLGSWALTRVSLTREIPFLSTFGAALRFSRSLIRSISRDRKSTTVTRYVHCTRIVSLVVNFAPDVARNCQKDFAGTIPSRDDVRSHRGTAILLRHHPR